ncbi:4'-phosphopantetheinyl transferase superfamily protein [Polaribacter sp. R77954]|uniref:4'-phosphopantetheinyl transferase superfamily protein n=1 Tax=Polaribacter sp. R77954 TaxID=3093870 RepID=UPI0037CA58CF
MIGNDIVDLNLAKTQSNWQRKGFLEKQFTDYEQKLIKNSDNPFLKVWLFWSMKEAAYKCYTQEFQKRFYAPLKFSCKIINKSTGIVKIESKKYYIKTNLTGRYVYSVAQEYQSKKMVSHLFFVDKNENKTKKIKQKLLACFDQKVWLKKNGLGIPYLYQHNKKLPISISTTHHGNYGAFVISYL